MGFLQPLELGGHLTKQSFHLELQETGRNREMEELSQGHTAGKWENWDRPSAAGSGSVFWNSRRTAIAMERHGRAGVFRLEEAGRRRRRTGAKGGKGTFQTAQGVRAHPRPTQGRASGAGLWLLCIPPSSSAGPLGTPAQRGDPRKVCRDAARVRDRGRP